MNKFIQAQQTNDLLGENGMPTHSTSGNPIVDLYYMMGGRPDETTLLQNFERAWAFSPILTARCMFYNRDARNGQGWRNTFRAMFRHLCSTRPDIANLLLPFVPRYGRWDDVYLTTVETPVELDAYDMCLSALKSGDKLCGKWMPRENKSHGDIAKRIMRAWGISPKDYRHLCTGNTQVVENLMCKNKWSAINYSQVPSKAAKQYRNAFFRHDTERFEQYVRELAKPENERDPKVKVNAGAIYPHDIVAAMVRSNSPVEESFLNSQWESLPNYVKEGESFLPVCDTSGSMYSGNPSPMFICISLGIYLSQRNKGPFENAFFTFSDTPELEVLSGNLKSRIKQLASSNWGMSTNLELLFSTMLQRAVAGKVPQEDMPKNLLILSDMQFNQCVENTESNAMQMIRQKYESAGYKMPNVIFWNLRTSTGVPVKVNESGVALVSGFSPSIMQDIFGGMVDPVAIVMNTLNRYSDISF